MSRLIYTAFIFGLSVFFSTKTLAQSVGLVLSGGGANGIAHIGVIKALEEHNIPIDYITGTSSGAFVGAMYAAGYSIPEIEAFFLSEQFSRMTKGEVKVENKFFFNQGLPTAEMMKLKFSKDLYFPSSVPTNLIDPSAVDYEIMQLFAPATAAANRNFDNLFVPFRCVAADIDNKEEYLFKSGDLSTAVRASFTYPFYIKPIKINNKTLFDGGLYNNFPHNHMVDIFKPDFIIGVKVTSNEDPTEIDNLFSQIKNMLISKTDFNLKTDGIILEPITNHGTFEFTDIQEIIDSGYSITIKNIEKIKENTSRTISTAELNSKRASFNAKKPTLTMGKLIISDITKKKKKYVRNNLWEKDSAKANEKFTKKYLRIIDNPYLSTLYPTTKYDSLTKKYVLEVKVKSEKPFEVEFGGNVSNRPISTGYLGFSLKDYERIGYQLRANSYFGRFYNSGLVGFDIDIPSKIPFKVQGSLVINNWNYFKSKPFFFDDKKPSYLVQTETFAESKITTPIGNRAKFNLIYSFSEFNDNYYQTKVFTSEDVPDNTRMNVNSIGAKYEFNTLNRKIYANTGTLLKMSYRYSSGEEHTNPGTTSSPVLKNTTTYHSWVNVNLKIDSYYKKKGSIRLGLYADMNYNTQDLFANYTASILKSPVFQPTPESKTLFLESFRAYDYLSAGHKLIISPFNNFDIRLGAFFMSPYRRVIKTETGDQDIELGFQSLFSIATGTVVYNTPVGPVSLGLNYYYNVPEIAPENTTPLTFLFHFGYIIFNKKALF